MNIPTIWRTLSAVDLNPFGIGVYEILVVATDGDADWAGDARGNSAGRTAVVGELFLSTSTRAKLNVDGDEWDTLHRADTPRMQSCVAESSSTPTKPDDFYLTAFQS